MNVKKDTKNLQKILYENRAHKNGNNAIKEFHKMHEYIIKLESKVENLTLSGVVRSKRFNKNDLLRAYQAGSLENLDKTITPTSMQDLKELLQDGEKWYKRYTEQLITYNVLYKNSNDMKKKIVIKLWYNMTFNKSENAKFFFELIENYYSLTENYMKYILTKNSY